MFDYINDEKNNNFMLYINKLYDIKNFNEMELKINDVISKISVITNDISVKNMEYSNTSLLYCCYLSYKIFKENNSNASLKNFYNLYTYLLISESKTSNKSSNKYNINILLNIKENLVFEKTNDVLYFLIDEENNIEFNNIKDYISIDDFLEINNSLKYWIKNPNHIFIMQWNKNFRKWELKNNSILINLYYIYLDNNINNINLIRNELLGLDLDKYYSHSLMYKLFLVAFSIELKNKPRSNVFFKILGKKLLINEKPDYLIYRLKDDFLFLAASFLSQSQFEKIILTDYKNIIKLTSLDELKEKYLKYRIPYFKQIYEHVNEIIFNYNDVLFNNAIKQNIIMEEKLKLIPREHFWVDEVNELDGVIMTSLTIYNKIGTKEHIFTSFSIKQKNEYIKNYLLNKMSDKNGSLKNLISVLEEDNKKEELINNLKEIRIKNKDSSLKIKADYIINYFKYLEQKNELNEKLIYFQNINFSEDNKIKIIRDLILKCFETDIKKFYFIFIDSSLINFAYKIYNFYINCLNNGKTDIFDSFYLEIKDKMNLNYKNLHKVSEYYSKLTWNNNYTFFHLVSLFVDPNILKQEPYFNIKFIANYIQNYYIIKKNNWNIAKIISLSDYTYVIWIIYMLYNQNNFYSAYKNFEDIFFSKIKINNIDDYFNDLIIKSTNTDIENPGIGTGITYMYESDIKVTCIFNLLIHYIVNPQNEEKLFELLKSHILFVISRELIEQVLYNLFDLYHSISININWKNRITKLLIFIKGKIRNKINDSPLKSTVNFSDEEIKALEGKIKSNFNYNLNNNFKYKKIYWILNYHLGQYDNQKVDSNYIKLIESDKLGPSNLIKRYKKYLKKF